MQIFKIQVYLQDLNPESYKTDFQIFRLSHFA